ncbi:MAG: hypothetical protein WCV73_01950 [Patescibacteria group bacterium]|jgi:hypothetical protein
MKKLYYILNLILFGGTVFAFYTVAQDFNKFYAIEWTFFKIQDCQIPNPVTTPCFWGSWAFLIALIWSLNLNKKEILTKLKSLKHLGIFLIAGTIFAWSNFSFVLFKFLKNNGQPTIGCSGQITTNPFTTPCFIGSTIFLVALIWAWLVYFVNTRKNKIGLDQ